MVCGRASRAPYLSPCLDFCRFTCPLLVSMGAHGHRLPSGYPLTTSYLGAAPVSVNDASNQRLSTARPAWVGRKATLSACPRPAAIGRTIILRLSLGPVLYPLLPHPSTVLYTQPPTSLSLLITDGNPNLLSYHELSQLELLQLQSVVVTHFIVAYNCRFRRRFPPQLF